MVDGGSAAPPAATSVVVAGVDGSPAARVAAGWAAADAARRGATLRLVHAITAPVGGGYLTPMLVRPAVADSIRAEADRMLRAIARELVTVHPGLRIEVEPRDGSAVGVLLEQSRHADVTVVGPDGAGRLSAAFFGSVAARVAAHGHGCVVVARQEPADRPTGTGDVVVGVDGSAHARAAIGFAYEEAALRGAGLIAIHTWNDKPVEHALHSYPLDIQAGAIDEQQGEILRTELAGWEQKYPQVPVHQRVIRGRAAPTLLRYATTTGDHSTQLLVVGSRGHGGFAGLLLGSTSQAVVAHAQCSVAVVHT